MEGEDAMSANPFLSGNKKSAAAGKISLSNVNSINQFKKKYRDTS